MKLLPTPMVGSSNPAAHGQISGDFRAAMDSALAEMNLLPTPRTTDANGAGAHGTGGLDLRTAIATHTGRVLSVARRIATPVEETGGGGHAVSIQDVAEHELLPTPSAAEAKKTVDTVYAGGNPSLTRAVLLPTPTASEGEKGGPNQAYGSGGTTISGTVAHLPTPRASRGALNTETAYLLGGERTDADRSQGEVVPGTDWGPYEAAIRRWERVLGRPAPSPVRHDGRDGKARLNPELTEWMMGWPAGWVTDPALGLTRAEQLKACGNGVVPQQAEAALREMLARPGVPAIEPRTAA